MKGCLKLPSPTPTPGVEGRSSFYSNPNSSTTSTASSSSESHATHTQRKTVAFGAEGSEEVYTADEWDRTPTEPAGKLSYQDLLELREIQRSLPRADQPYDLINSRRSRHYLSAVPIALLPLLSEDHVNTADVDDDVDEICSSRGSSQTSSGATSPAIGSPRSSSPTRWNSSSTSPSTTTSSPIASPLSQTSSHSSSPLAHYNWTDTDVDNSESTSAPCTTSAWSINFKRQSPTPTRPPPSTAPSRSSPTPSPRFPISQHHKPFSHPHYMSSKAPGTSVYTPPAHLAHLVPTRVAPQRQKPSFSFLPLLDTPPPSSPVSGPVNVGAEEATLIAALDPEADLTIPSTSSDSALLMAALNLNAIEASSSSSSEDAIHTDTEGDLTSDTDMSSIYDPPTPSLTHASLDSSPPTSRASSCEPELGPEPSDMFRFPLPTPPPIGGGYKRGGQGQDSYFAPHEGQNHPHAPTQGHAHLFHNLPPLRSDFRAVGSAAAFGFGATPGKLEALSSPSLVPPSPLMLDEVEVKKRKEMKPRKKRNFIVVNDMEIELDGSDDEDEGEKEVEVGAEEKENAAATTTDVASPIGPTPLADTALSETQKQFFCPMTPPSKPIDVTKSSFSIPQPNSPSLSTTLSSPLSSSASEAPNTPTPSPPSQPLALADAGAGTGPSTSTTSAYMHPSAPAEMDLHIPVRFKRAQMKDQPLTRA